MLKQPWKEIKGFLKSYNLTQQIGAFDPTTVDYKCYQRIEKEYLSLNEFTISRANKASKALGPIVEWIASCVEYGTIWHEIQPMVEEIETLEKAIAAHELQEEIDRKMNSSNDSSNPEMKNDFSFASDKDYDDEDNDNNDDDDDDEESGDEKETELVTVVSGLTEEELEAQIGKINEENELIAKSLGELEGKLKIMFDKIEQEKTKENEKEKEEKSDVDNDNENVNVIENEIQLQKEKGNENEKEKEMQYDQDNDKDDNQEELEQEYLQVKEDKTEDKTEDKPDDKTEDNQDQSEQLENTDQSYAAEQKDETEQSDDREKREKREKRDNTDKTDKMDRQDKKEKIDDTNRSEVDTEMLRGLIESTMKNVFEIEGKKLFDSKKENVVVKHEVAQSSVSQVSQVSTTSIETEDLLHKKDLMNILPFNDVIESIKSIENKMREIQMITQTTNEDMTKNLDKISNNSNKTNKTLINNINKIETNLNESNESISKKLQSIKQSNSKSIKTNDANNEIITNNLNTIINTINNMNDASVKRNDKLSETILKYIEVVNNNVNSLANTLDTTAKDIKDLGSSTNVIQNEIATKSKESKEDAQDNNNNSNSQYNQYFENNEKNKASDNRNVGLAKEEMMEMQETLFGKIESSVIDAKDILSKKIDLVNGEYFSKTGELYDKKNEMLRDIMSREMKELKIEFETFFSNVKESIEGLKGEFSQTFKTTNKLHKDLSSVNDKLDSVQFEQQLLRQQQTEAEEKRQEFYDKLEMQQKDFLSKQEELLRSGIADNNVSNVSNISGVGSSNISKSKGQSKGQYKMVSDQEERPLLVCYYIFFVGSIFLLSLK